MTMLSKLLAMSGSELKSTLQSVDTSAVKGRGLRRRFEKIRAKEGGFTLLELLVVVAILAAVASTTFAMLQDTDRRAAAGAHVHAMGQIASALIVYPKLNNNKYPAVWDSLFDQPNENSGNWLSIVSSDLTGQLSNTTPLTIGELNALSSVGIYAVRGIVPTAHSNGCGSLKTLIENKNNDVVPSQIYQLSSTQTGKGGCGGNNLATLAVNGGSLSNVTQGTVALAVGTKVARWDGDPARLGVVGGLPAHDSLIAFGVTDGVSLIDRNAYAGLATAPIYRHVETHEYPGYVVIFRVTPSGGYYDDDDDDPNTPDVWVTDADVEGSVVFQAVVDGAGDTREEELGELDNLRNT